MKGVSVYTRLLHDAGLRATPARLLLLGVLSKYPQPLTVTEIAVKLPHVNQVTVYRALVALVSAGLVRTVNVQHAYTHYELVATKRHHHHAICSVCGHIEDVHVCLPESLERGVLGKLHGFSAITGHSLEFIGTCNKCTV